MAKNFTTNIVIGGKLNPSLQKAFTTAGKYAQKTADIMSKTTNKVSSATEKLHEKVSSVTNVAKKVAVVGGILGGAAILGGKSMLDQAANMEQYRNTLNVVMKDQKKAAELFKWATDFANKTPFDTDGVVDATVKLQSYGLEAQKMLPIVGDMASAMGKGLDQAVEAISDAQTGELERLKEFGITKQMIVEQANKKLAGIEIVNNKGQITNQKAFNLALSSLMKERFNGGMETQAKTFKGVMSTIQGVWKTGLSRMAGISESGEVVAGSFFDVIRNKASVLAEKLEQMQSDGTFDKIQSKIADMTASAIDGIENLIPKAIEIADYVKTNGPEIIDTIEKIAIGFIGWKVIEGLANGIVVISTLSGAINNLRTVHLVSASAKSKDILATLYLQGLYAKDAILASLKTAGTWAMVGAQGALNLVTTIGTGIMTAFGAVLAFITSPIGLVVLAIGGLIAAGVILYKNWDSVSSFLVNSWDGIKAGFAEGINWVVEKINWLIEKINLIPGVKIPLIPEMGYRTSKDNTSYNAAVSKSMDMYASGGIATRASIFGEAGPEMAIPLRRTPRSLSLLEHTSKILGVDGNGKSTGDTFIYAPNFGSTPSDDLVQIIKSSYDDFVMYMQKYKRDKGRVSYGTK